MKKHRNSFFSDYDYRLYFFIGLNTLIKFWNKVAISGSIFSVNFTLYQFSGKFELTCHTF